MRKDKQTKLLRLLDTGVVSVDMNKGVVYTSRNCRGRLRKEVKGSLNYKGYLQTQIGYKGRVINFKIHQIVYLYAHRSIPRDKVIDHIDNNKLNNRISNLQLLSLRENIKKSHNDTPRFLKGSKNNNARLTESQVIEIRVKAKTKTLAELSREYGVTKSPLSAIINRKAWRHI